MNSQLWFNRTLALVAVTVCAAMVAFTTGRLLGSRGQNLPSYTSPPHALRDLSVARHIGPTLKELHANFAVLRRPATAHEHSLLSTYVAPTNGQPQVPEYIRQAGVVDGIHVYFVVYPIFRHGVTGPVAAYQMHVVADGGFPYVPSNYLIFPAELSDAGPGGVAQPVAYLGVVPDGVRTVRWHFTCKTAPAHSDCQLPGSGVVSISVRHNLAMLPITTGSNSIALPAVDRVTWYRRDGSHTIFSNVNKAVPFPGAPAWPR